MEGEKMAYKMMNQDFVKLDKFDGSNFIRWQDKMKFLLTALKIFYVLDPNLQPIPDPTPQDTEQLKQQRIKKEEDELVCRGHILNTLSDRLYDLFTTMTSPKEIWKALETKYKTEKQGTDKFIIQKYFDFKMMDNVSVLDQVHELQILVHKLNDLSIKIPELFQVGAIIAKLPPSWNNYRKKLLHMAEELTLEQIGTHLRIEEESRIREGTNYVSKVNEGTVNYVLNGGVGSSKTNKSFRPNKKIVKKTNSNKDKKGRACFHCGKKGHYIRECRFLKNQMKEKELNTSEANVVDEIVAMVSEMQIGMITEVHMANAAENSSEWWYDSGATIHVCNNKMLFKEYVEVGNGLEVLMGNHNTAKVLGTGTVELILRFYPTLEFQDPKRTKLGPRAIKSVFVGYAVNSKAYRLLDLSSNTIVESRDVEFIENKFINDSQIEPKQTQESDSLVNDSLSGNKRIEPSSPNEQRRSQRVRKEKDFGPDFISYQVNVYLVEGNREKVLSKLPFVGNVEEDPNTYSEAMASRDAAFWREAVNDEMDSILSNNTWVLVDLPPSSNTIGCKWVFRRKYRTDGTIQTFKARLVAKGFRQREGIDYFDTYAPVARITSIRVLIALASIYKLVVHQMDVKTAFLNGDLDEEVYMDQPEGFVLPGNEKKVYKLVKSLYGLKQAPKQWHEKFDTVILANGFKHNGADKCVYSKFTSEYGVIVCLYVDDMLIFGTNMLGVCETKKYLASVFKMKDLNEADTILGIKVKRHSEGYALCQNHYIEKVLLKYKHLNVKEVNTPFDSNYKLVENTGRAIAQLEFASAIGSMMYAMHCTRPDIAFAVNRLSRYTSNPSAEHWKAIARVLGYLKKTKDLGLYYSGYPAVLEGYSDANWVTSVGDNKSTSGWIFTLGGGAISWASKKQSCISHSTMESEFIALASAGKEAEWLRNMLYDIELWPQPMSAISIYCDSQATMSKAYSKIYNGKSRHISLRHEYVRQLVEDGVISIVYVKSSGNLADPFTKGLSRDMTGFEDLGSLEFLPNPVYWTTNPVDWMTCIWLIQSPGLVVQSTGCRAWEFLPDSVAWTTNSGDWITAVRGS
uniref:CCHC-type domain-containing protein n=2 Tax=Fagus sylvatica TaxID=28930 RepID=A0A2N9GRF5_FAGSY